VLCAIFSKDYKIAHRIRPDVTKVSPCHSNDTLWIPLIIKIKYQFEAISIEKQNLISSATGAFRESNSGPLAPKARIIPLDQMPSQRCCHFCGLNSEYFLKSILLLRPFILVIVIKEILEALSEVGFENHTTRPNALYAHRMHLQDTFWFHLNHIPIDYMISIRYIYFLSNEI
jgi:hypothetical protein